MKSLKKKKQTYSFKEAQHNGEVRLAKITEEKFAKERRMLEKSRSQSKIKQTRAKKPDTSFKTKKKSQIIDQKVNSITKESIQLADILVCLNKLT